MKEQQQGNQAAPGWDVVQDQGAGVQVRERPILFSAPMVRALLAGTKTQTRRAIRFPESMLDDGAMPTICYGGGDWGRQGVGFSFYVAGTGTRVLPCRYGLSGDRLWVRETWQAVSGNDRARRIVTQPRPDTGWIEYAATPRDDEPAYKWRPSIHMPRWASRILLEVTDVRVQRLQDISEADARAEGCCATGWTPSYSNPDNAGMDRGKSAIEDYAELWESINGAGSWGRNDWVWAVSFRVIEPASHCAPLTDK